VGFEKIEGFVNNGAMVKKQGWGQMIDTHGGFECITEYLPMRRGFFIRSLRKNLVFENRTVGGGGLERTPIGRRDK